MHRGAGPCGDLIDAHDFVAVVDTERHRGGRTGNGQVEETVAVGEHEPIGVPGGRVGIAYQEKSWNLVTPSEHHPGQRQFARCGRLSPRALLGGRPLTSR